MIHDVSTTLQAMLDDPTMGTQFPELLAANVVFERPDESFTPQAPAAIDLFLYEIRENLMLRNNEPIVERNGTQATAHPPPRRIDCAYLLTAWPTGEDPLELREHQLLGQALQVLSRYPKIPNIYLQGSLINQEPALPMMTPQAEGLQNPADFWHAMGNKMRAAFSVTVTFSMAVFPEVSDPVVTHKVAAFGVGESIVDESVLQIGGRIVDAGGSGIAEVVIDILDAGQRTHSDAEGYYYFTRVPRGTRTVRVVAVGFHPQSRTVEAPGQQHEYEFTLTAL